MARASDLSAGEVLRSFGMLREHLRGPLSPRRIYGILQISSNGRIGILAGGDYGISDGQGTQAKFANLHMGCFAFGPDGSLFVTDSLTCVRKITRSGTVTTLADSSGRQLQFRGARGLACDAEGNLYIADSSECRIYKVTVNRGSKPVAGSGKRGLEDGPVQKASFQEPTGVAVS